MNKYDILKTVLFPFQENLDLDHEQRYDLFTNNIVNGFVNKDELKSEFQNALSDQNFDWLQLAKESELFIEPEKYTNEEIKEYVKSLIRSYLYEKNNK